MEFLIGGDWLVMKETMYTYFGSYNNGKDHTTGEGPQIQGELGKSQSDLVMALIVSGKGQMWKHVGSFN